MTHLPPLNSGVNTAEYKVVSLYFMIIFTGKSNIYIVSDERLSRKRGIDMFRFGNIFII